MLMLLMLHCLSVPGGCSPLTENPTRFLEPTPQTIEGPRPIALSHPPLLTTVHTGCKMKRALKESLPTPHFLLQRYCWGAPKEPPPKVGLVFLRSRVGISVGGGLTRTLLGLELELRGATTMTGGVTLALIVHSA